MRVGRFEISASFLLLFAWLNYCDTEKRLFLTVTACFFHELGHCFALRVLHINIRLIRLTCIGAQIYLERSMTAAQECFVSFCGPAINLILSCFSFYIFHHKAFFRINLVLACLNLMPIGQLDGGRILQSAMSCVLSETVTQRIINLLHVILGVILLFFGGALIYFSGNFTLFLVASWLLSRTIPIPKKRKTQILLKESK